VVASTLVVIGDPTPAATAAASASSGVTELTSPVALTAWPWAAVVVGGLAVVVAVWGAVSARGWAATSGRHERADAAAAGAGVTSGAATTPATEGTTAPDDGTAAAPDDPAGPDDEIDPHDAWDALSRGDDPTGR